MSKKVVLIVGASGVGKDTLLRFAKEIFKDNEKFNFVKRYITRQPDENENNFYLKQNAFDILEKNNHFVSTWNAHGNSYAIAKECIENKVNIISISRSHIKDFEAIFDEVITINITVPSDVLLQRLRNRGRESEEQIQKRVQRASAKPLGKRVIDFDNNEAIEISSEKFIDLLNKIALDEIKGLI